jgi:arabinogalactan oligomer/maltooligosaccharide transport system substrate-binding protein
VQNGAIDPVPMADTSKASFLPAAVQGVTFNGQIYGVPYAVENVAL